MGTDSFDIWTLWNQTAALILKAGQSACDNQATVYIMPNADMSKVMSNAIIQLSAIFAYKSEIISLEQFAQEMKTQTIYFSTPFGDDDQGNQKIFLCSSPGICNRTAERM